MSIQRGGMMGMTPTLTDGSMPWRAANILTTAQRRIADNDRLCRLIRLLCSHRPWHNKPTACLGCKRWAFVRHHHDHALEA
jgi:hypothetical protein